MSRILTTLTCLCISYLAIGQTSEKIMVYGHVADLDTRAPLEGAWVYLMDCNRQLLDSVQADRKEMNYKDAGYMFRATYLPGQYHMKIVYPGYYSPVIPFELKSASEPLQKLLKSAVANAENNFGMDPAKLVVSEVYATPGPILKRMMPRAQGRAYRINKRTSHVTLAVTEKA